MSKRDLEYAELQDLQWLWSDANISKAERQREKNKHTFYQNTMKQLLSYVPEKDNRNWHNGVFRTLIWQGDDMQGSVTKLQAYLLSLSTVDEQDKAEIRAIPVVYQLSEDERKAQEKIRLENKQMDDAIATIIGRTEDMSEARAVWNKMGGQKSWGKIHSFVTELCRVELLPLRSTLEEILKTTGKQVRSKF